MIPKLKFEVIANPKEMVNSINDFLIPSEKEFNWSSVYTERYPEFGKLINNVKKSEEIEKISEDFFTKLYNSKLLELKKIANDFQEEWDQRGEKLLIALAEIVDKKWTENYKDIKVNISLNPICPRYLEQHSFVLYWKSPLNEVTVTVLHEVLHFIWFEKWKEVFPNYNKVEFESPHLVWKLSEMVPLAILEDKKIQDIFQHEPSVYQEWKNAKIKGKPLLSYIQAIYDNKKSLADFMTESWRFMIKNEQEINSIK